LPEGEILRRLGSASIRLRAQSVLWAASAGGALFAALVVLGLGAIAAAASSFALAAVIVMRGSGGWTRAAAARVIESTDPSLENLAVTAAELLERPRPIRADIRAEILRQADERLAGVRLQFAVPLARPAVVCAAVMFGCVAAVWGAAQRQVPGAIRAAGTQGQQPASIAAIHVRIVPPVYSSRPVESIDDPIQVSVLAGSTVTIEVISNATAISVDGDSPPFSLVRSDDRFVAEWVANRPIGVSLRAAASEEAARFLSVFTIEDGPPAVRIRTPGKDLVVTPATGPVDLVVDTSDDLGLSSLVLKFTRASGGGESVTFTEGELPLTITRDDDRRWTGTARWAIGGLKLADGDVLVYRAVARDRNPNGAPVQSESFVIEVGRSAGAAESGFAIPAEEKKYAISQQMVIYKTEQLIANRGAHAADWLDQNRLLAIEQRMVRAEIVFLGGGEVEDEEVEAAASDELTEGRLQNAGRAEMLRAINAMSRAERQLNDGKAVEALVFEHAALKSLELAFDRRRYFLRTLSERGRIDPARRLTGTLRDARSWSRDVAQVPEDSLKERERLVMRELASALTGEAARDAQLAAHLTALDASSPELRQAAVEIARATVDTRRAAIEAAMRALSARARARLSSPADINLPTDALRGRLADELPQARSGRVPR
jgi:hypothetical protein